MSILRMMITNDDYSKELGLVVFDSDHEPWNMETNDNFGLLPETKEKRKLFDCMIDTVLDADIPDEFFETKLNDE